MKLSEEGLSIIPMSIIYIIYSYFSLNKVSNYQY